MSQYGTFEYGGVRFTRLVPQEEISSYVSTLSDEKKGDIQQVVLALESAGLLAIEQMPQEDVTAQQERQMGYSESPNPIETQQRQYGVLQASSPTLAAQSGLEQPVGSDMSNRPAEMLHYSQQPQMPSQPLFMMNMPQKQSVYEGQTPSPPKPGSISASLKVNPSLLRRN